MVTKLRDLNIEAFEHLPAPAQLLAERPASPVVKLNVLAAREALQEAIAGRDRRLVVIVGPCSIHDPDAVLEYAGRLRALSERVSHCMLLVMRTYFEKPRTTVGWKGYINDPDLDGSCRVERGLRAARDLLLAINELRVPCATEFLDPIVPQYISDLVSWAAIGARTTESQTHREMTSGLSMPVGFKNATDGSLQLAIDGMTAARRPHAFFGITENGQACVVRTRGNQNVHLVLRGGPKPNFSRPHLAFAESSLEDALGRRLILVDCSHGNSGKQHQRQPEVFDSVLAERLGGRRSLLGVMLESHLLAGNQRPGPEMARGRSITDACMDWATTEALLLQAADRMKGTLSATGEHRD